MDVGGLGCGKDIGIGYGFAGGIHRFEVYSFDAEQLTAG